MDLNVDCEHITEGNRCLVDINFGWLGCNNNVISESSFFLWDRLGNQVASTHRINDFLHSIFDNRKCELDIKNKKLILYIK